MKARVLKMEYILTEKGLFVPIILPLILQWMLIIDIGKGISKRNKKIVIIVWYLILGISGGVLYLCKFDRYLCYIWILIFIFGYPLLHKFALLGDKLNSDLSEREQKIYNKIIAVFIAITGCCIFVFAIFGGLSKFIVKGLRTEVALLSKILYIVLGILFIFRVIYEYSKLQR